MKPIQLAYLKLLHYSKNVKSIYELVFLGIILTGALALSILSTNYIVEKWASFFLGLTIGLILVKLPAIVTYFKGNKPAAVQEKVYAEQLPLPYSIIFSQFYFFSDRSIIADNAFPRWEFYDDLHGRFPGNINCLVDDPVFQIQLPYSFILSRFYIVSRRPGI